MPCEDKVEVHQQHQRQQRLDRVQNLGDMPIAPLARQRPATDQPPRTSDQRGPDRRPRERSRRCPENKKARQRPTNPPDPFKRDQPRHQPKPLSTLKNAVAEANQGDRPHGQRQKDNGPRVVDVQQPHEQRRRHKSRQHDRATGQQTKGDKLPPILLGILRNLERDHRLQPHRRNRPDDKDSRQRPKLPKRRRDKKACRDHRHHIARDVRTRKGRGHIEGTHPSPG